MFVLADVNADAGLVAVEADLVDIDHGVAIGIEDWMALRVARGAVDDEACLQDGSTRVIQADMARQLCMWYKMKLSFEYARK